MKIKLNSNNPICEELVYILTIHYSCFSQYENIKLRSIKVKPVNQMRKSRDGEIYAINFTAKEKRLNSIGINFHIYDFFKYISFNLLWFRHTRASIVLPRHCNRIDITDRIETLLKVNNRNTKLLKI